MQKWEYLYEQAETVREFNEILQKAGEAGWELVTVDSVPSKRMSGSGPLAQMVPITYWNFFFKRPKA